MTHLTLLVSLAVVAAGDPAKPARAATPAVESMAPLAWHTDYRIAFGQAKKKQKRLFIYFCDTNTSRFCNEFESDTLADSNVRRLLAQYELLRLPLGATTTTGTTERVVLEHASLAEMRSMPGIAIVELAERASPHYGYVVSQIPFQAKKYFQRDDFHSVRSLAVLLALPSASLTQRTMIYAVRTHHESPASVTGKLSAYLTDESRKHSEHQARIQLQGHHGWDERFAAINTRLESELVPVEVCAESWPGENLAEAAIECVYSWRRSAGHWSAVSAYHPHYGYDMRRGANGIWYATGIFGKSRSVDQ